MCVFQSRVRLTPRYEVNGRYDIFGCVHHDCTRSHGYTIRVCPLPPFCFQTWRMSSHDVWLSECKRTDNAVYAALRSCIIQIDLSGTTTTSRALLKGWEIQGTARQWVGFWVCADEWAPHKVRLLWVNRYYLCGLTRNHQGIELSCDSSPINYAWNLKQQLLIL